MGGYAFTEYRGTPDGAANKLREVIVVGGGGGTAPLRESSVTLSAAGAWDEPSRTILLSKAGLASAAVRVEAQDRVAVRLGRAKGEGPTVMGRWTAAVDADPGLAASRARADDEQRRVRRSLAGPALGHDGGASLELGVGGASRTGSLKCLHAHVAFALARPGYELGERMVEELQPLWPRVCCTARG